MSAALGFGLRANVCRSSAMSPNFDSQVALAARAIEGGAL
jgi:hypothetical protein